MELQVHNGAAVEVNDAIFGANFNEALIHQVVVAYMAGGRSGSKAQKNRAAVSGGGIKPWRQKGTGRARAGTIRSPLWRGGGKTFAATPQDHSQKVNRKMYRAAMRAIVSELLRQERLVIVEQLAPSEPKTKAMVASLADLGVSRGLLLLAEPNDAVLRSSRNIPHIEVATADVVDPVSLVAADKVVTTVDALRKLEERLQ